MKKFACILVMIFSIYCVGCASPKKTDISLNDAIKMANKNRDSSKAPSSVEGYLYNYNKGDEGFTDAEVDMLTNISDDEKNKEFDSVKKITREMAISDVNYLFRIFKYTYGGYQYFGGDKVFDAAKEKIISNINNKQELTAGELERIIEDSIDFIKDGHFRINNFSPIDKYKKIYFYSENYEFYKDEKSYYTIIDKKKYYLKSVQGSSKVLDYMKLTINKEGKLVYNIGLLQNKFDAKFILNIKLLNGNKELNKQVSLTSSAAWSWNRNDIGFQKQILNGIPIVKCTRMYDMDVNDKTCRQFEETGKELKKSAISIVDIKGNYGGSDLSSNEWFEGYTGKKPEVSVSGGQLESKLFVTMSLRYTEKMMNNKENLTTDEYNQVLNYYNQLVTISKNKNFNKWETINQTGVLVDNKNIVFVLIDNGVASSGETFVRNLRTLKNVIFVGTNTAGCGTIMNNSFYKLPNSGMVMYFGTGLILTNGFEEGTGFTPDIWLSSDNALDRVMKLIANSKK